MQKQEDRGVVSVYQTASGFLEVHCDVEGIRRCPNQEVQFIGNRTEDEILRYMLEYGGWYRTNGGMWKCPRCREDERKQRKCL